MCDVGILQIALCVLAGDLFHGIDKQHLATLCGLFVGTADNDTGFHRGIEKQVRPQADHAINHIALHQLFPHFFLFVAEQNAMREEDRAATGAGIQACKDMLEEGIICTPLWRGS